MSKTRLAVALLAGTGVAGALVWAVPSLHDKAARMVHDGSARLRQARIGTHPPSPPVARRPPSDEPHKLTSRVLEEPTPPASPAVRVSAAEAVARPAVEVDPPPGPTLVQTDPDGQRVRQALLLYRTGDLAAGDAVAGTVSTAGARLTLEWAALRLMPQQAGLAREQAFAAAHPEWPSMPWLRRRIEEALAARRSDITGSIGTGPSADPPQTIAGRLAVVRWDEARGDLDAARALVSEIWRNEDLTSWQQSAILKEFGDLVGKGDHKYRADRLLYKEDVSAAMKEAAAAGSDVVALAKARAAVINGGASDALIAAVPKPLQSDPGLIFSRIQKARRADRIDEAANLMLAAPRDPRLLIDGDEWWVERRLLARKLLDRGEAERAYKIVVGHSASSPASRIEAEFHAGWIALRFLDDPRRAIGHFDAVAALAETPISRARAAYWQGRTAEAAGELSAADGFYARAARYPITFYGQLATGKIGQADIVLGEDTPPAVGDARCDAVKVAEYLFGLGARDIALPLALDVARNEDSEAQVAAMGAVVEQARDAWATLAIGKAATQRGMSLAGAAFPTFGIPEFQPLPKSADLAVVYAIARQESEFDQRSSSAAGAKGIMQMISSTARRTAEHAGIGYDDARLVNDAAFNARLGAAHLGELLDEQGGSLILTFAAYNAGGKNVKDWIDAYGDPRKPGVDPVDWIERIPFTETRNYVQRVLENVAVYRLRLGRTSTLAGGSDLPAAGRKGT